MDVFGVLLIIDNLQKKETYVSGVDIWMLAFYHDLIDEHVDNINACDDYDENGNEGDCGPIDDQVSGFGNSQMFDLLDFSTTSPLIFKDKLIQGESNTVQTQVNNLYNSY